MFAGMVLSSVTRILDGARVSGDLLVRGGESPCQTPAHRSLLSSQRVDRGVSPQNHLIHPCSLLLPGNTVSTRHPQQLARPPPSVSQTHLPKRGMPSQSRRPQTAGQAGLAQSPKPTRHTHAHTCRSVSLASVPVWGAAVRGGGDMRAPGHSP